MSDKKVPVLTPEEETFLSRLEDKDSASITAISVTERLAPMAGRVRASDMNRSKSISAGERDEVKRLFTDTRAAYPSKSRCYAAIAAELGIKSDRVRYIIEGPRSKS